MSRKMIDYKAEDGKIKSIDGYKVGGDYSVKVEKIESNFSGSGGSNPAYWESNDSNKIIQPNKHYDVGFSTAICYKKNYNTQKLEPNQFIIPVGGYHTLGFNQRIKQYGEVVLQVTSIETEYNVVNKPNSKCVIEVTYHYTYTVVTPGTTGDTVELPQYPASAYLSYEVVTLGIADA